MLTRSADSGMRGLPRARAASESRRSGLLSGKLGPEQLPHGTVPRLRLLAMLTRAVQRAPVILISGPAGSGKTTLAASWRNAQADGSPVAWLTLDAYDDDPATFWIYVVESLVRAGIDAQGLDGLVSGEALPTSFIPRLAGVLLAQSGPTTLVIDRADQITDPTILAALDLLIHNAGARLRLVLCARADPQLPLHQYRLADTLAEIRCDQLAFTPGETVDLLHAGGIEAADAVAERLCQETGGWAVGLRLAVAPLKQGMAPERLVSALVEDDGSVTQYLFAEVLRDQPTGVRRFLLRASVTDELWPSLVDRLAGRPNSRRVLAALAHANAFVEQVPGAPGGYRIHPLFQEMLRAQLCYDHPQDVARLHRICAAWYADAGHSQAAVEHAVAAEDWPFATHLLIEALLVGRLLAHELDATLRGMAALPDDLAGPDAAVIRVATALSLDRPPVGADVAQSAAAAADPGNGLALRASAAVVSVAAAAADTGQYPAQGMIDAADELVTALPVARRTERCEMAAVLSAARFLVAVRTDAPTPELLAHIGAAAVAAHAVGSRRLRFRPLAYLALLEALAGRSTRARRLAAAAETEWAGRGRPEAKRSPAVAAALAWAHLDRYELEEARDRITRVREHAIPADAAIVGPLVAVLQSRLLRVRHEYDKAEATMAAHVEDRGLPRWVREQVVTEAVRTCFARGAVADGLALLDPDEDGAGWTVRLRVAAGVDGLVAGELPPAGTSADVPPIVAVENGILRASSALDAGAGALAVAELSHALELAAPETLRWPFLDAPPRARRLLRMHSDLKAKGAWLSPSAPAPRTHTATGGEPPRRPEPAPLIQELSEREREVLVHLSEMLSTAEIAATMFISVNTVRTHIRSILRKLSATRRNQAVRRARELGVI